MSSKESWGSRMGLILAMAGNAVGLGNFLRFPVQVVQNGGGAFIIPYLVCFFLMGIPLLFIEWAIGRYGGKYGNHSTPYLLDTMGKGRIWKYIGVFGVFTNIAVGAYYCYIESWTMAYVFHSLKGTFIDMPKEGVAQFFTNYLDVESSSTGIPFEAVIFYVFCILINSFILSKGIAGVEKVAKIGMPLLILFGVVLAIRGATLGTSGASEAFPDASAIDGFNFLWTPQLDSIWDPKVWLAAAGQIFFTLAVGMGTIHCYASYLKEKDDIVLNSFSAGFMNEFIEIVLGGAIVIPIAAGYLGIDWVKENAGFGMAFQTMPYLFQQWGSIIAPFAGVMWFGLLFFAGITSSLAFGTPWMGFMKDEFGWGKLKGSWSFGFMVLLFGLPTVFLHKYGVFDEYDYWAGTIGLVVFSLLETLLFVYVFGMEKGWQAIVSGADIKLSIVYKYIIKYITPVLLSIVFLSAFITPKNNNWLGEIHSLSQGKGWHLDNASIIKKIANADIYEEIKNEQTPDRKAFLEKKLFFVNVSRLLLVGLFLFICILVYLAYQKRRREGRVFQ